MADPLVSHGRGGQANIRKASPKHLDDPNAPNEPTNDLGLRALSEGRGGAGNLKAPQKQQQQLQQKQEADATENVPRNRIVTGSDNIQMGNTTDYHVGRGGEGNRRRSIDEGRAESADVEKGLIGKIKDRISGKKVDKAQS